MCGKCIYATELASSFVVLGLGLIRAAGAASSRVARGSLASSWSFAGLLVTL